MFNFPKEACIETKEQVEIGDGVTLSLKKIGCKTCGEEHSNEDDIQTTFAGHYLVYGELCEVFESKDSVRCPNCGNIHTPKIFIICDGDTNSVITLVDGALEYDTQKKEF